MIINGYVCNRYGLLYRSRIEALGFSIRGWARACGVSRKTIERHYMAEEKEDYDSIPGSFWTALDLFETLDQHKELIMSAEGGED